jgi:hypothetical protein
MHKKKGSEATHFKKNDFYFIQGSGTYQKRLLDIILYAVRKDKVHTEIT